MSTRRPGRNDRSGYGGIVEHAAFTASSDPGLARSIAMLIDERCELRVNALPR